MQLPMSDMCSYAASHVYGVCQRHAKLHLWYKRVRWQILQVCAAHDAFQRMDGNPHLMYSINAAQIC